MRRESEAERVGDVSGGTGRETLQDRARKVNCKGREERARREVG